MQSTQGQGSYDLGGASATFGSAGAGGGIGGTEVVKKQDTSLKAMLIANQAQLSKLKRGLALLTGSMLGAGESTNDETKASSASSLTLPVNMVHDQYEVLWDCNRTIDLLGKSLLGDEWKYE